MPLHSHMMRHVHRPRRTRKAKCWLGVAGKLGLDMFALGTHHNPPFVTSSPTTTLAYIGAATSRILLSTATTLITTNDAVKIAMTPTFNAFYSGLLKAFFDLLDAEAIASTPMILGATGGTARHSLVIDMAMRSLFSYLRAIPVPTSVFAASEGFASPGRAGSISARATRVAGEALALFGSRNAHAGNAGAPARETTTESCGREGSAKRDSDGGQATVGIANPEVLRSPAGDFTPFDRIAKNLSGS